MEIKKSEFVQNGRDFILAQFDEYVRVNFADVLANGWIDSDLPQLIPAIDAQLDRIVARYSEKDSDEFNSGLITFTD